MLNICVSITRINKKVILPIMTKQQFYLGCIIRAILYIHQWRVDQKQPTLIKYSYSYFILQQQMQNLDKSQASTISEITFDSLGSDNQAKLIKIIRNLQLELGYHGIAVRKAERMINLLQAQNHNIKVENQQLTNKCSNLEFQLTKLQNQFNKIGLSLPSSKMINNSSTEAKQKKSFFDEDEIHSNLRVKQINSIGPKKRPKSQVADETTLSHQSNGKLSIKNSNLFASSDSIVRKNLKQSNRNELKTNQISFNQNHKQVRKQNIKSKSPIKNTVQTLSFIPFDQLSIKTRWS